MHFTVSFAFLFALTIVSQAETFPRVVFRGDVLPNHSYVPFAEVQHDGTDYGVECHTDLPTCCTRQQGNPAGTWHFPNGSRLSFNQLSDAHTFMRRLPQKVVLYQRQGGSAKHSGIYQCLVPTLSSSSGEKMVYVGIYRGNDGKQIFNKQVFLSVVFMLYLISFDFMQFIGDLQIRDDISFNLVWKIAAGSPVFTLTCISTGGPATTVSWFRDSHNVVGGITMLDNTVTSQYTHILTVTGRLGGLYGCSVSNTKPSTAVKNITIHGMFNNYVTAWWLNLTSSHKFWSCIHRKYGAVLFLLCV